MAARGAWSRYRTSHRTPPCGAESWVGALRGREGLCYRRAILQGLANVIIDCPSCQAKYQYDPARFEGKPSKKIRCAKCQTVFEVANPALAPEEPSAPPAPPAKTGLDETVSKKKTFAFGKRNPAADEPEETALPPGRRFSVAILDGEGAGRVIRIERPRAVIGRSDSDIIINDTEASRNHALLEIRGGGIWLEDLGSTNGTFANGERIHQSIEIFNQSEFQIGGTTLMLIVTETD